MTTTPAMPERFTKKPVTIEAVQFTEALRDAIVLDGAPCPEGVERGATAWHQKDRKIWRAEFFIYTLEGRMNVEIGDWIIKGVKGEFYPCKPDIFEMTYDRATLQAQPAEVSDERGLLQEFIDAYDAMSPSFDAEAWTERARAILALRPQAVPMTDAARDVLAERQRQISAEGWTPKHDDRHHDGSMALAAACYACNAATWADRPAAIPQSDYVRLSSPGFRWPWAQKWWKPKSPRHDLVRAAALTLAEIERRDRAAAITAPAGGEVK